MLGNNQFVYWTFLNLCANSSMISYPRIDGDIVASSILVELVLPQGVVDCDGLVDYKVCALKR